MNKNELIKSTNEMNVIAFEQGERMNLDWHSGHEDEKYFRVSDFRIAFINEYVNLDVMIFSIPYAPLLLLRRSCIEIHTMLIHSPR